jgi:hypothetical protein
MSTPDRIFIDGGGSIQRKCMSARTITVTLPEPLLDYLETQAQAAARTIDELVAEVLVRNTVPAVEATLPVAVQQELKALELLSDEAVWTIAQSAMNGDKLALYDLLRERYQDETITPAGLEMLESLHVEADHLMLRKAHAYAILKSRGHSISLPGNHQPDAP